LGAIYDVMRGIDSSAIIMHNYFERNFVYIMVKIRLRRMGAPKKPCYRVVVADSHSPRDGAFISIIGHYNPLTEPETITIEEQATLDWLKKGAQPTETVARLLKKAGIMDKLEVAKEKS